MTVRALRGTREVVVDEDEIAAVFDATDGPIVVDVGTGDARYAYETARQRPDALVIGFDPAPERMRETARKAARSTAKGGLHNLSLWRASIETPPAVLRGRADEVHVILPWGALLRGIVDAELAVIDGLSALGHAGTIYRIVLNAGAWLDPPADLLDVAAPTPSQLERIAIPAFAARGVALEVGVLDPETAAAIPSTWTARLAHAGRTPDFVELRTPPSV